MFYSRSRLFVIEGRVAAGAVLVPVGRLPVVVEEKIVEIIILSVVLEVVVVIVPVINGISDISCRITAQVVLAVETVVLARVVIILLLLLRLL